jgi:hypothetical protein
MNFILQTIPELLVMSWFPSETLHVSPYHSITTLASMSVKCVTLQVREYVDMIKTPLLLIINNGTWKSVMTPTYSLKLIISEPRFRGFN